MAFGGSQIHGIPLESSDGEEYGADGHRGGSAGKLHTYPCGLTPLSSAALTQWLAHSPLSKG